MRSLQKLERINAFPTEIGYSCRAEVLIFVVAPQSSATIKNNVIKYKLLTKKR